MRERVPARWVRAATVLLTLVTGNPVVAQQAATPAATWQEVRRIPVPAEYPRVMEVRLSPDGTRIAFVATWQTEEGGTQGKTFTKKTALFVDGARFTEDYYMIHSPVFSPDGKRLVYVTATPVDNTITAESWRLHLDQKVLARRAWPTPPVFSSDGSRLAWLTDTSPSIFKPKTALFVDDKLVSEQVFRFFTFSMTNEEELDSEPLVAFSPDGSKVAYTAKLDKKAALIVNDKVVSPEVDLVGPPKFSPDGRVVYQVKTKKGWCLMADGAKATAEFDRVGKPVFTRDGSKIAFRARQGKKWAVWVGDRKMSPDFEKLGPIAVSVDGAAVAYPVRIAKMWTVYINDRKLPVEFKLPKLGSDGLRGFALNADGSRVVYRYESFQESELNYYGVPEKSYVLINDKQVTPDFTALDYVIVDGKTIVFAGHDPQRHEIVVGKTEF
jgi:hypothetical protein